MTEQYLNQMKLRLIRISVSASSTRNQIGKGKINRIRTEINDLLSLHNLMYQIKDETDYLRMLNYATNKLVRKAGIHWGTARKLLNICIREFVYNSYLRKYLLIAESDLYKLEIPIDSHTYKYIVKMNKFKAFKWPGIIHIQSKENKTIQQAYVSFALSKNMAPIHLDVDAW